MGNRGQEEDSMMNPTIREAPPGNCQRLKCLLIWNPMRRLKGGEQDLLHVLTEGIEESSVMMSVML
jgi:hypothetical protein